MANDNLPKEVKRRCEGKYMGIWKEGDDPEKYIANHFRFTVDSLVQAALELNLSQEDLSDVGTMAALRLAETERRMRKIEKS